jgi:D-allose transport system substrate-binding protein
MRVLRRSIISTAVLAICALGLLNQAKAAEYAVVLKTLSNPFWVTMKEGIESEAKKLGVQVDVVSSPSEGDAKLNCSCLKTS